jgi:hypothetical protein
MANVQSFSRTYNSFSGVDMLVTFGGNLIGEVQGISYTIQREKAPIYTMGSADPRAFSRGKRGIAGSVIFMVFDRSALLDVFRDVKYAAWVTEPSVSLEGITTPALDVPDGLDGRVGTVGTVGVVVLDKVLASVIYHDQVLPFEIVITAANEYGNNMFMKIHGVEIINCGSGMSVDDITTDESCTFIATGITPWKVGQTIRIPGFNDAMPIEPAQV